MDGCRTGRAPGIPCSGAASLASVLWEFLGWLRACPCLPCWLRPEELPFKDACLICSLHGGRVSHAPWVDVPGES